MDKIWVDLYLSTLLKSGEKHINGFGYILWSIGLIQDAPYDSEQPKHRHFQISPKLQHFY